MVLGEGARDRLEKSSSVREAAFESCPALVVLQLTAVWPRADTKIRVVIKKKHSRVRGRPHEISRCPVKLSVCVAPGGAMAEPDDATAADAWSDFGQKVDLTARLREILLNYPEGTSILKELVQNAVRRDRSC